MPHNKFTVCCDFTLTANRPKVAMLLKLLQLMVIRICFFHVEILLLSNNHIYEKDESYVDFDLN